MKVKCPDCGKKEMELMSKAEIKMCSFTSSVDVNKILDIISDLFSPKFFVCKNCGYIKEA